MKRVVTGAHAVIHLACISNDPSFELNPALSRAINYDCFEPLVAMSRERGVRYPRGLTTNRMSSSSTGSR